MPGAVELLIVGFVVVAFMLILVLVLRKGGREKDNASETRMLQEIYQDLQRMEDRLAALETILLERERK